MYQQNLHSDSGLVLTRNNLQIVFSISPGYPRHRENRENGQKHSLSGRTQGIWKFCQNTGNFVCSTCKFHDSNGKGYCNICRKNSLAFFFPKSWKGLLRIDYCGLGPFSSIPSNLMIFISLLKVLICIIH